MTDEAREPVDTGAEESAEPDESRAEVTESDNADAVDEAPAATGPGWGAAYSSLIRFGAGFVGTAMASAREARSSPPPAPAPPDEATGDESGDGAYQPGSVVFGFAADLPNRIERATTSIGDSTGVVKSTVSFGWRVVAASPIGWVIAKPVDAVRERVDAETERLAAIGRQEYAEGRVMFDAVVDNTIDGVLDNVADNEALNDLIRDQALGITDAAVQEVRETGAAADNMTDSIVRKLLRREPRSLPPRPADGGE